MGRLFCFFFVQTMFFSLLGVPLQHNPQMQPYMKQLKPLQLVIQQSPYSMSETMERLEKGIKAKGIAIFAIIDHSGAAQKVNMKLIDEKVIIFGDPKVGTFLMQENPLIGMELPLRILVWQNAEGDIQIAYIDPMTLGESYEIIRNSEILKKMSTGLANLVAEVVKPSPE